MCRRSHGAAIEATRPRYAGLDMRQRQVAPVVDEAQEAAVGKRERRRVAAGVRDGVELARSIRRGRRPSETSDRPLGDVSVNPRRALPTFLRLK
jgi:hypothetical protein